MNRDVNATRQRTMHADGQGQSLRTIHTDPSWRLRGRPVIVPQEAAQPLSTGDRCVGARRRRRAQQLVAETLMVRFVMVVCNELADRVA